MNVAEYIEILQTFPQGLPVVTEDRDETCCPRGYYDDAEWPYIVTTPGRYGIARRRRHPHEPLEPSWQGVVIS